ncbi:MAG: hypothetical protein WKF73_06350 [Nocardioidaceae bacterium]
MSVGVVTGAASEEAATSGTSSLAVSRRTEVIDRTILVSHEGQGPPDDLRASLNGMQEQRRAEGHDHTHDDGTGDSASDPER